MKFVYYFLWRKMKPLMFIYLIQTHHSLWMIYVGADHLVEVAAPPWTSPPWQSTSGLKFHQSEISNNKFIFCMQVVQSKLYVTLYRMTSHLMLTFVLAENSLKQIFMGLLSLNSNQSGMSPWIGWHLTLHWFLFGAGNSMKWILCTQSIMLPMHDNISHYVKFCFWQEIVWNGFLWIYLPKVAYIYNEFSLPWLHTTSETWQLHNLSCLPMWNVWL